MSLDLGTKQILNGLTIAVNRLTTAINSQNPPTGLTPSEKEQAEQWFRDYLDRLEKATRPVPPIDEPGEIQLRTPVRFVEKCKCDKL